MKKEPPFRKLSRAVSDMLPASVSEDLKRNLDSVVKRQFEKLNLVTHEELAIQEKVLQRTRERLTELEQRVSELEQNQKD